MPGYPALRTCFVHVELADAGLYAHTLQLSLIHVPLTEGRAQELTFRAAFQAYVPFREEEMLLQRNPKQDVQKEMRKMGKRLIQIVVHLYSCYLPWTLSRKWTLSGGPDPYDANDAGAAAGAGQRTQGGEA
ncbi:hypothetical protein PRCB_17615 [Pantoea rodasii]|uniref:Uncharacterized protein n=1 Tax=Pantoea rodasii TaxID=1076549 RepID=A0A2M9W976_9GAMM|nr:hypothetical protein HA45_12750 [Pantoea rodasii]PJZ04097.1 hypothetical protein PRCB_17615 [Pantoea rodasii]